MAQRELYIDRLRSVMTALVVLHHTAITYGSAGGWFWRERQPDGSLSSFLLIVFCAVNQAYFMGFFFLLAGYFTPASLERKGYARFLGDRLLRLGIPLLAFILFLGPLTAAMVNAFEGDGFWPAIAWIWSHHMMLNGPLWFAQALLLFSFAYCGWRMLAGRPLTNALRISKQIPGGHVWLASALGMGLVALGIRQFVPTGVNVFGLQLGYFAAYIFLFAAGIAAWRYRWLEQLNWKGARVAIVAAIVALPAMPAAVVYAVATHSANLANFSGGLSWPAVLYALWEPFVALGLIAALLLIFRTWMNGPSAAWAWLGRRAYAVYIVHPPVLVGISLLLHGWAAPALVKFAATGTMSCAACWLISDPLVRMPGIRRVV